MRLNDISIRSLKNLSPIEALHPDNIGKLQSFFLKRRAEKNQSRLKRKSYFEVGQLVKKVITNPFRNRGYQHRFSIKNYKILAVLDDQVPVAYRLSEHPKNKIFYKEQLVAVGDESELRTSRVEKRILGIISAKHFPTKWLRSGKPTQYELKYLVRLDDKTDGVYMSRNDIEQYDNGPELLKHFDEKKSK